MLGLRNVFCRKDEKMQIKNTTEYDTRYLRSLFILCDKHEGCHITNPRMRGRSVTVKPSKCGRVHGYAWYNTTSIVMSLPKNANVRVVAQIYIHELGHNLGLHHNEMASHGAFDMSWLPDEAVPLKTEPPQRVKHRQSFRPPQCN